MIAAVKHAASIRNPEFDARQRARRSTWDTPRLLYSYDETAEGDLSYRGGCTRFWRNWLIKPAVRYTSTPSAPLAIVTTSAAQRRSGPSRPPPPDTSLKKTQVC